jgi:hypothetical protein
MSEKVIEPNTKYKLDSFDKKVIFSFLTLIILFILIGIITHYQLLEFVPILIIVFLSIIIMLIISIFLIISVFTETKIKPHLSSLEASKNAKNSIERKIIISDNYLKTGKKDVLFFIIFILSCVSISFIIGYFLFGFHENWITQIILLIVFLIIFLSLIIGFYNTIKTSEGEIATHFQNKYNGILIRKKNGETEFINYKNMTCIYKTECFDERVITYISEKKKWFNTDSFTLDKPNAELIQKLYLENEKSPLKIIENN